MSRGSEAAGAAAQRGWWSRWRQGEDSIVLMSLQGQSPALELPLSIQQPHCLCCASLSVIWQPFRHPGVIGTAQGWPCPRVAALSSALAALPWGCITPFPGCYGAGGYFCPSAQLLVCP